MPVVWEQGAACAELPAVFACRLPSGRLYTDHGACLAVISRDGFVLGDVSTQFRYGAASDLPVEKNNVFGPAKFETPVHFPHRVCSMVTGGGASNYFHWLFDVLPRLHVFRQSGLFHPEDRLLVPYKERFQMAMLDFMGVRKEQILNSYEFNHVTADELIVANQARRGVWIPPWICDFLRGSFPQLSPSGQHGPRCVYVWRRDTEKRRLSNEDDILRELSARGFTAVTLSELSFGEQVALFAEADVIVSPHGAGLANLVFCRKGARVIELFSRPYVTPLYCMLARNLGLRYDFVVGEETTSETPLQRAAVLDYRVDLRHLMNKVDTILAA